MKKKLIVIILLMANVESFAQDSTKKASTIITGSVDAYYRYNFNNPEDYPYNSLTSFTHSNNSFELGMASLRADHSYGKVAATIDLGFGKRAEEFAYNDANTRFALKQLYVTYAPVSSIRFTFGTWATHIGYELLDAYLNHNYSMSYLFTNGPFSHTGLKADITLHGKSAFMIGISNPTDYRSAPSMPKSVIAQFSTGTKDDKFKLYLNFAGGKQNNNKKTIQGDLVATYIVTSEVSIGLNSTLQNVQLRDSVNNRNKYNWWGTALYLNVTPVAWFNLTWRNEYIADKDGYLGLKNVFASTLSANFIIDNLTVIPEFRLDEAGNPVFTKNINQTTKSTGSCILAVTYHFNN
ncbi:MAG TPA: outer membrane beta-barrel protein [Chitinophagaceae bacterium]|nr:outer membrane beta-barrel protein [Chitinophagaceae bacterium]